MKVRILTGESAGTVLELPADFARRLIIRGEVAEVLESSSGLTVIHTDYAIATIQPPEDTSKLRK